MIEVILSGLWTGVSWAFWLVAVFGGFWISILIIIFMIGVVKKGIVEKIQAAWFMLQYRLARKKVLDDAEKKFGENQ